MCCMNKNISFFVTKWAFFATNIVRQYDYQISKKSLK